MTDPLSMAWDNVGIGSFNIVDAHGHIGAVDNFLIPETSADDVVNTMDQLNITRCYISPLIGMYDAQLGHKHILDAVRRFSGRIAGVPIANPNYPEEIGSYLLGWCKDLDARMIKVHPNFHDYPINGPRYRPVLEFAAKHALPVLVHTWAGDPTCDPEIFMRLAAEHPETIFILGHSGATVAGNRRAVEVAKARANVYLDLACSITYDGML